MNLYKGPVSVLKNISKQFLTCLSVYIPSYTTEQKGQKWMSTHI